MKVELGSAPLPVNILLQIKQLIESGEVGVNEVDENNVSALRKVG